jgi:hypothetical protein
MQEPAPRNGELESYELRHTSNSTTTGSSHTDLVSTTNQPSHDSMECTCGTAIEAAKRVVDVHVDRVAFGVDSIQTFR